MRLRLSTASRGRRLHDFLVGKPPRVEFEKKKTLSVQFQLLEEVNSPSDAADVFRRQNELSEATAQLATPSFAGFNHGALPSAVNASGMLFQQQRTALPAADRQPFQALTAPSNLLPGLPSFPTYTGPRNQLLADQVKPMGPSKGSSWHAAGHPGRRGCGS